MAFSRRKLGDGSDMGNPWGKVDDTTKLHDGYTPSVLTEVGESASPFRLDSVDSNFSNWPPTPNGTLVAQVVREFVFKPGKLGLAKDLADKVTRVDPGGQADNQGVQVGMRIMTVDGGPYTRAAIKTVMAGRNHYKLGMVEANGDDVLGGSVLESPSRTVSSRSRSASEGRRRRLRETHAYAHRNRDMEEVCHSLSRPRASTPTACGCRDKAHVLERYGESTWREAVKLTPVKRVQNWLSPRHEFRTFTFAKPCKCKCCDGFLWGVSHQGVKCVFCKIAWCHSCAASASETSDNACHNAPILVQNLTSRGVIEEQPHASSAYSGSLKALIGLGVVSSCMGKPSKIVMTPALLSVMADSQKVSTSDECVPALQASYRRNLLREASQGTAPSPEKILSQYFTGAYLEGKFIDPSLLKQGGYSETWSRELRTTVFEHKETGVSIWSQALDFSTTRDIQVVFLYTAGNRFLTLTNIECESSAVRAALDDGLTNFGKGVCVTRREPNIFGCMEAILYNSYSVRIFKEPQEFNKPERCRCCIPIIVDSDMIYDVRERQTKEMVVGPGKGTAGEDIDELDKNGHPIHPEKIFMVAVPVDLKDKLKNIFQLGRDIIVLPRILEYPGICWPNNLSSRLEKDDDCIGHARGNLGTVLKRRLDWVERTYGRDHVNYAQAARGRARYLTARAGYQAADDLLRTALIVFMAKSSIRGDIGLTRNDIALVCSKQLKYDEALDHHQRALEADTAIFGECHPEVAMTRRCMGQVYELQSKFDKAVTQYQSALEIQTTKLGERHPEVVQTRSNLAAAFSQQSMYVEAVEQHQKVLDMKIASLGPFHVEVAQTRDSIGAVLSKQCQHSASLSQYKLALDSKIASLGQSHPDVAQTQIGMAVMFSMQANYPEALQHYKLALEVLIEFFGDRHLGVAQARQSIGHLYWQQLKYVDALEQYQLALDIKINILGEHHLEVAQTTKNIGAVYSKQSQYVEALKQYQKALDIKIAIFGERHSEVALTRNSMGLVYEKQSMHDEAVKQYQSALNILKSTMGDRHPDVARTSIRLGDVYVEQSKYDEALQQYLLACDIQIGSLGEKHPDVALTHCSMGRSYEQQSKFDDALQQYKQALDIKIVTKSPRKEAILSPRLVSGDIHQDAAETRNHIGRVYSKQGKQAEALEQYQIALDLQIAGFGDHHPKVAKTRMNMGAAYSKDSKNDEAVQQYQLALASYVTSLGERHPEVGQARISLAAVFSEQSKDAEALEEYKKGLDIQITTLGARHPEVAQTRSNIGEVYRHLSKTPEALKQYQLALEIDVAAFGVNHPNAQKRREKIAAMNGLTPRLTVPTTCPKGHDLKPVVTHLDDGSCDVCGGEIQQNGIFHVCWDCNYCQCSKCAAKAGKRVKL